MSRKAKPKGPGNKDQLDYDEPVKLPDDDPEKVIRELLKVRPDQATSDEDDDSEGDGR